MAKTTKAQKAATVADVAREAKVSKAQAARALGGYGAVSDDVHSRVTRAAEQLGYRPNMVARTMNTGRSQSIGVVVGDIENPFFGLAMRGIADEARIAGYNVVLLNSSESHATEVEAVSVLLDQRVDGLILAASLSPDIQHLNDFVDSGRPIVLLDRGVEGLDVDLVRAEVEQAAFEATTLLLQAGHTRIAFVSTIRSRPSESGTETDLGLTPVAQRLAGIRRAFVRENVPFDNALITLNARENGSVGESVRALLTGPNRATALIASDSVIAQEALEEIHALDLAMPDDLSFIMFDDFAWARLVTPPITVVAQPIYELGATAARTLFARLRSEEPEPAPSFEATLILRDSVAPPNRELAADTVH
ncbi:LacI family DNA-binding transcriptional regulator [Humidisolicoccus flavus]|uniref:LacI family DNA-binding transcriptional regulator n=1 Tax=Humidisolicoccus flavus TaxID=3111414 RepID=UPI00324805A4